MDYRPQNSDAIYHCGELFLDKRLDPHTLVTIIVATKCVTTTIVTKKISVCILNGGHLMSIHRDFTILSLFKPEDSELLKGELHFKLGEYPLKNSAWASLKTLFWLIVAIVCGLLIGQLH